MKKIPASSKVVKSGTHLISDFNLLSFLLESSVMAVSGVYQSIILSSVIRKNKNHIFVSQLSLLQVDELGKVASHEFDT